MIELVSLLGMNYKDAEEIIRQQGLIPESLPFNMPCPSITLEKDVVRLIYGKAGNVIEAETQASIDAKHSG